MFAYLLGLCWIICALCWSATLYLLQSVSYKQIDNMLINLSSNNARAQSALLRWASIAWWAGLPLQSLQCLCLRLWRVSYPTVERRCIRNALKMSQHQQQRGTGRGLKETRKFVNRFYGWWVSEPVTDWVLLLFNSNWFLFCIFIKFLLHSIKFFKFWS